MDQKIKEILAEILLFTVTEDNMDLNLFESGHMDSFAHIEMINVLEDEFSFSIPIEIIEEGALNTYNRILKYVSDESM